MHIEIKNFPAFAAVSNFISSEPTRYYLNGVHIQRAPAGGLHYVATTGHYLCVGYDSEGSMLEAPKEGVILQLPGNKPLKAKKYFAYKQAEIKDNVLHAYDHDKEECMLVTEIDGEYPNWKNLIPDTSKPAEKAYYNASYSALFQEVAIKLGADKYPYIHSYSDSPSPIILSDKVYGLIMPVREPAIPEGASLNCPGMITPRPKLKAVA